MSTVEVTRANRKTVVVSAPARNSVIEVSDPGVAGPPNVLSVGTVTAGVTAAVTITGTPPSQTLNFVLPAGASYVHNQSTSASTWTISHNLGFFPSVTVVDSGGTTVIGDVSYITENQVSITFSAAFGGKAYFS
jgi:hypothetical protein